MRQTAPDPMASPTEMPSTRASPGAEVRRQRRRVVVRRRESMLSDRTGGHPIAAVEVRVDLGWGYWTGTSARTMVIGHGACSAV
ncbi:hypothetical protein Slala02_10550 [Streptomyces lavendulae subsp. lavendulae]|nr:hypothetical protein Slala02_10550 [Streptomyces lavendulae subsp. lavendulae]